MKVLLRRPEFIILTLLALITRLWGVLTPNAVVFDEVYFKVYAGDYLAGSYYFDPHPPLGKLLLAAWGWLTHQSADVLTSATAAAPVMRILPALAGALIIPVFYQFLRLLGASRRMAALGAALLLLDNGLLVESRFILIDSLLILFGLSAITCYLAARRHTGIRHAGLVAASLALAGMAASTKWTGLTAFGLIGLVWLYDTGKQLYRRQASPWRVAIGLISLIVIPFTVYVGTFYVHFGLLPKSGQGDAFMSQRFQETLQGNPSYNPDTRLSFAEKFWDLNRAMKESEDSLRTATHPYGSKWYTWPVMLRSVYYWQGETLANNTQGNIYLLGNPVIWWGIIAVIGSALSSIQVFKNARPYRFAIGLLIIAYCANFLPFIAIVRVMFLYHYFFALIFSLALAVILLGIMAGWTNHDLNFWRFPSPASRNLYLGILVFAIAGFLYFAPLSYGIPLSSSGLQSHMWLPSWR